MPPATKHGGKSIAKIAKEIGRPTRTVADLLNKGMPRDPGPERDAWLANHDATAKNRPKGVLAGLPDDASTRQLIDEKLRQEIRYRELKNEEQTIRNDKLKGIVIEMKEAEEVYGRLVAMAAQNIRSVARSVCDLLTHKDDPSEIERIISASIESAIEPLFSEPSDDRFRKVVQESFQTVQGAGKTHRKPVGRKKRHSDGT